jgi:hypothetical protein
MNKLEKILIQLINLQNKSKTDNEKKIIDEFIFKGLSKISYLFKSADYAFEHEVRVIQYMPLGSQLIKTDDSNPPKLYIESNKPLLPYLSKIFIGPKAENADHWAAYLDFRVRERARTDSKKYAVEVRKSDCKFR